MKASSISNLKKELHTLPAGDVLEICMKLIKYRKENKELLTYLLFDANNEPEFIRNIKNEIDAQFLEINPGHLYFVKKSLRKILRNIDKYVRYSGHKQTEVELRMYYCAKLKSSAIPFQHSNSLNNLYINQLRKIHLALNALHEDLQYDYNRELKELKI
jgi:hypothetical protein